MVAPLQARHLRCAMASHHRRSHHHLVGVTGSIRHPPSPGMGCSHPHRLSRRRRLVVVVVGTVRPLFREGTVSPLRPLGQAERSVSPCNSPLRLHRVGKITGEPPKRCMLGAVGPSSSFSSSWEVASLFQHAASPWRRVGWRTDKHAEGRAGLTAWWGACSLRQVPHSSKPSHGILVGSYP